MRGFWRHVAAVAAISMLLSAGLAGGAAALTAPRSGPATATGRVGPAAPSAPSGVNDSEWSDFDDDGFDDLAIGAPYDDVGGVPDAGVVHVLYGSASGLTATGSQVWTQDSPNVATNAEANDHFGWSLARGDFDGDGFGDLAIGVPDEDIDPGDPVVDIGGVNVLYGSASGLVADVRQPFLAPDPHLPSTSHDRIGASLAPLDVFDTGTAAAAGAGPRGGVHDGTDLAIGMPNANDGSGGVWLVGGTFLDPDAALGSEATPSFGSFPGCHIGQSLAAGDFDLDVRDDLALGAPGCDIAIGTAGTGDDAGAVFVLRNGDASQIDLLFQGGAFRGTPEAGDKLGKSVAVNDLTGDGIDDLFAGAPGEDIGADADAGIISIAVRSADHLQWELPATDLTRKIMGGANLAGARFGGALATGDLGDTDRGLAIGAPGDTIGSAGGAGSVWISAGNDPYQGWSQDTSGVLDTAEPDDAFGSRLAVGDFDGTGFGDLAIGIRREDVGTIANAGAVAVLYAGIDGKLSAAGDDFWTQDSPGIGETSQPGDQLGSSVR